MAVNFYESFSDEAISASELFITKAPLASYVTYTSVSRDASGKAQKIVLPTNWNTMVGHPANELRFHGVSTYDGFSTPSGQTERGDELWVGLSALVPTGKLITPNQGPIILQWHKETAGSQPPYALSIQSDGRFRVLMFTGLGTRSYHSTFSIASNTWYDIVAHVKWSSSSNGLAETWINGEKVVDFTGPTIEPTPERYVYLKYGMYCWQWNSETPEEEKEMLFDEVRFGESGSSFAEVDPAQGGGSAPPVDPPTPPSGTGNIVVRSEYANSPTNTTDVVMTDADITGTPAAALTFAVATGGARLSAGMIDGTTTASIQIRTRDANATSDTRGRPSQSKLIELMLDNSTTLAHVATGSLGTGGLTLSKASSPTNAAEVIAMMFAGADVDADVHIFDNSSSLNGTYTKTGLTFEPNLLFFLNVNRDFTLGTDVTNARFNLGIATTISNQYNYSWYEVHAAATSDVRAQLSNDRVFESLSTDMYLELTSINSDGYVVTTRGAAVAAQETAVLAMRIDANVYLNLITLPTGTGSQSYSVGFAPQAAMVLSTQMQVLNTTKFDYQAGAFGIGMLDEDGNRALAISSEDNVGTTNTESFSNDAFVWLPSDAGATQVVGSGSFGATSVNVNYTNVSAASYALLLAIEYVEPDAGRVKKKALNQGMNQGLNIGLH